MPDTTPPPNTRRPLEPARDSHAAPAKLRPIDVLLDACRLVSNAGASPIRPRLIESIHAVDQHGQPVHADSPHATTLTLTLEGEAAVRGTRIWRDRDRRRYRWTLHATAVEVEVEP